MSVAGIGSSSFCDYNSQSVQNKKQQFRDEFQQLGKDLQSGNLSAAQADFTTIQQQRTQGKSSTSSTQSNPLAQDVDQLSQDLQSGNLTAAQQDYAKIQSDAQRATPQTQGHHHHHHSSGGGGGGGGISQLMSQLGDALQAGNMSAAQQSYTSLEQDFQEYMQTGAIFSGAQPMEVNA